MKDRAADLRLQRLYGITLAEYNMLLKAQKGVCAICSRPPKKNRLAVDHNHAIERTKITVTRDETIWTATARPVHAQMSLLQGFATDKKAAIAYVRKSLKRLSVRGLLCMICNRKVLGVMERFKIRPAKVIDYLKKFDSENSLISKSKSGV